MTIAEIQEYIDIKIKYYSEIDQNLFTPIINVKREFEEVKKLLDELEPKAEWVVSEKPNHFECSNCGNKRVIKTKYCSNCGLRMESKK